MIIQKVYLAGGFKTNWQSKIKEQFENDFIFFDPRTHNLKQYINYLAWDKHFLSNCDIVFAYMEKTNPSGFGLTLEIGIANALNKTIILIDEKSKTDKEFNKYFKIVYPCASVVFDNIKLGIKYLSSFAYSKL